MTNTASHIAAVEIIEGVAYELHHSNRVRVFDVDAHEVVTIVCYPSKSAAAAAYAEAIAAAKATA
jgi:hypothetical protein